MELTIDNVKEEVLNMLDEKYEKNTELLKSLLKLYFYIDENDRITPEEEALLEKDYVDIIHEQGKKFEKDADINNLEIKKIVTAISYSKKRNIFSELPFEKDLRIFKNINTIYFLYIRLT